MRIPTIHLNGTSGEALVEALDKVAATLDLALAQMIEVRPNGRDYYPQGPTATSEATLEHVDRERRLASVKDEIDQIRVALYDQQMGRRPFV